MKTVPAAEIQRLSVIAGSADIVVVDNGKARVATMQGTWAVDTALPWGLRVSGSQIVEILNFEAEYRSSDDDYDLMNGFGEAIVPTRRTLSVSEKAGFTSWRVGSASLTLKAPGEGQGLQIGVEAERSAFMHNNLICEVPTRAFARAVAMAHRYNDREVEVSLQPGEVTVTAYKYFAHQIIQSFEDKLEAVYDGPSMTLAFDTLQLLMLTTVLEDDKLFMRYNKDSREAPAVLFVMDTASGITAVIPQITGLSS